MSFCAQVAVVGEQEQAAALGVESADGVDAAAEVGRQEVDGAELGLPAAGLGDVGADHAGGLVEQDVDVPRLPAAADFRVRRADVLAVDADFVVAGLDQDRQVADDLAVDLHAALDDQFFTSPSRGDAATGEVFLDALGHESGV